MRHLVLCALLAFAAAARAQKPVETERKEREEREEEREREARERGQREYRERSEKGKAAPGDDEALYALGAILGSRVNGYGLSKKELQRVERGFADAAEDRKLELRDPDLEEWGPKVDAMLQRRGNPRIAGEKERGRKVADLESKKPAPNGFPAGSSSFPSGPEMDRGRRRPTACG